MLGSSLYSRYKKPKTILGFDMLSPYAQEAYRHARYKKPARYFLDVVSISLSYCRQKLLMILLLSVVLHMTKFALRIVHVDLRLTIWTLIVLTFLFLMSLLQTAKHLSILFCFFLFRFIPLSTDLVGSGVVSRLELRENQIRECMKAVDTNPTSVDAWMKYVQLYGIFAEEAESKKERVEI